MKRIIFTIAVTAIIFAGCETAPYADFSVSKTVVETGEDIYFYNQSSYALDFEWDFGDGYKAYRENPIHRYTEPGIYEVRLSAIDNDYSDHAYMEIKVIEPVTVLHIEVLEYFDQYPVPEASVILYPTYNDWLDQTNAVLEVYTDKNGIATIEGLEPLNYYVDVWHESHDNYALADEDMGFVKISGIERGHVNYFTAWVDYVSRLKSADQKRARVQSTREESRTYDPEKKNKK
jgi:PKD repeat protein